MSTQASTPQRAAEGGIAAGMAGAEWALEGGPKTLPQGSGTRRAGGDLRYQSRRMLVRAERALCSAKPGGTAEVSVSLLSQQSKLGTEAFSFVPQQQRKGEQNHE